MIENKASRPSVLVIDSGIGGLSICKSILASGISVDIRYLADNAAFPYGSKSDSFLVARLETLIKESIRLFGIDIIVLACNTISTLVLPRLRSIFSIPIVGVVPAIKPAAALSKNKIVGLLATPGTVSRPYTQQLIDDFAHDCKVFRIGSSVLVEQAERYLLEGRLDEATIARELEPFKQHECSPDTVVLGCTHFPFIKEALALSMPDIVWIDSGEAVARRVVDLLHGQVNKNSAEPEHTIFFTGDVPASAHFQERLREIGLEGASLACMYVEEKMQ